MSLAKKVLGLTEKKEKFEVGDEVALSRKFLKSIFDNSHDSGSARGIIKELKPLGSITLAVIDWKKGKWVGDKVNVANLVLKNKVQFEER